MKTIEVLLNGVDTLIETALDDYEYNYKLLQKKLSKKADPREDDGEAIPLLGLLGGLGGRGAVGGLGRGAVGSGGGKGGTTIAYMPSGGDGGSFGQNATASGTSKGNVKGWLTRKHGANTAQKKKSTGLYSKSLHSWAKSKADDLQLDDSFVKKYPNNWIEMSYRIAYTMAKKRFK